MDDAHKHQLIESAHALIAALEADDDQQAEHQLAQLTQGRDNNLFIEVGKLTRDLHAAISNFDVDSRIANMIEVDIPDSRERLDYVITLTHDAAHNTLQAIDNLSPAIQQLQDSTQLLAEQCQSHFSQHQALDSDSTLHQQLTQHFDSVIKQTTQLQSGLSDITLAQGFQDLTGQVLRKVTDLIEEVETSLVDLIRVAAEYQPDKQPNRKKETVDPLKAEGPQINNANSVNNQDDVDDLLSSLGF